MLDNVHVGASGLMAASAGFNATAQNISNAQTPGFGRRSVELSIANPIRDGLVQLGQGVTVDAISRNESGLLGRQIIDAAADFSRSRSLAETLGQVEPLVNETLAAGARTELSEFFDAVALASADPSDPGLRDTVIESATDVASSIEGLAEGFERLREAFAEQLELELPTLSEKLQRVAMLNQRLRAAGGSQNAPDIADQLDRLVRELGEDGGIAATISVDGLATVMLDANAIVEEGSARAVVVTDPARAAVEADSGTIPVDLGGRLGGLQDAYDAVTGYLEQLDTLAADFASAINGVQAGGFDQTGSPGSPLFDFDPTNPAASLTVAAGFSTADLALASDPSAAAGDGGNIEAFLGVETDASPGRALSAITDAISLDAASAMARAERDGTVLSDLDALDDSLNGVNLDEEAVNLTAYQTAYQASARVMNVANDLIGTLLELT